MTAPFIVALHVTAGARHLILFGARQLHCIAAQLCFSAHDNISAITVFYKNLLELELEESYTINKEFLEGKSEVQSWHRAVLVDWLIQVQRKFGLLQETLYICMDTLDRYLQVSSMDMKFKGSLRFLSTF